VLRQLEAMEIKVFNGVKAMEVSRDKLYTHQVMAENGINIPKYTHTHSLSSLLLD
jgi:glutathione synthase/RimK-type ligase-like ATP-grasp enzyme